VMHLAARSPLPRDVAAGGSRHASLRVREQYGRSGGETLGHAIRRTQLAPLDVFGARSC